MSAPNLLSLSTVNSKTATQNVVTYATAIVTNNASSNTIVKINGLIISNVDGANTVDINIDFYRANVAYRLGYLINIPQKTTIDFLSKSINLEEGDSLRLTASSNNKSESIASYEVMS